MLVIQFYSFLLILEICDIHDDWQKTWFNKYNANVRETDRRILNFQDRTTIVDQFPCKLIFFQMAYNTFVSKIYAVVIVQILGILHSDTDSVFCLK